jgi:CrcB protein
VITAAAFLVLAGAGAATRGLIGRALNPVGGFPTGTLLVNVSGSFALGLLVGVDAPAFTLLGVALLGAYTTFSSFTRDAVALAEERQWAAAAGYVLSTCTLTVAAAAAGIALTPHR